MSDDLADKLLEETKQGVSMDDLIKRIEEVERGAAPQGPTEADIAKVADDEKGLYQLIGEMTVAQKIKLALKGNKTARGLLLRDTSKQIPLFVLQNPGIGEDEVLEAVKSTEVSELVHRAISRNKAWTKSYGIKLAMVSNPKVPVDISMQWLKHIRDRDLRRLMKSKNIPSAVATQARKLVEKRTRKK